jgi:hypothetical protein
VHARRGPVLSVKWIAYQLAARGVLIRGQTHETEFAVLEPGFVGRSLEPATERLKCGGLSLWPHLISDIPQQAHAASQ